MKFLPGLIVKLSIFALILTTGCSGYKSSVNPIIPDKPDSPPAICASDGILSLMSGSFEIDKENGLVNVKENRDSQYNFNITNLLSYACPGGCFKFRITGINGTVLTIELKVENPTSLQVYDLRLIYLNTYGKTVLNPDSYTDLLTGGGIKPFTAFGKEYLYRAFPVGPGAIDTEELLLDYPAGASPMVDFIIVASYPGNTQEPYEIRDMDIDGEITDQGGEAEFSLYAMDHQDNVSSVVADTTIFTGDLTIFEKDPLNPGRYYASIYNTEGAPAGSYYIWVCAQSSNDQNANTYNYFTVDVSSEYCSGEVHEYVGTYNVTGVEFSQLVEFYSADIAYLEAGPYAGKIIYMYDCYRIGMIDPLAEDQVMTVFNDNGFECNDYTFFTLESCPMTGRIFQVIRPSTPWYATIFAPDGTELGYWYDAGSKLISAEIDDHGDLWLMVVVGNEPEEAFLLRHYKYLQDEPFYETPAMHETFITEKEVFEDSIVCYDIAMDFEKDKLFMFMGYLIDDAYWIAAYDVSSGYAVELKKRGDVFTKSISGSGTSDGNGWRADIEIDHTSQEYCRIVVGACTFYYPEGYHFELIRLDDQLNVIDFDDSYPCYADKSLMPVAFTIIPEGNHPIITIPDVRNDVMGATFSYFESPDW